MKKQLTILAVILGAALVFAACASTTYPINTEKYTGNVVYWDENLPREESVELLLFSTGLTVTSYNGVPVNWGEKPRVFLPSGPAVFTLDLNRLDVVSVYMTGSTIFVWDFKAGDRFSVTGWTRDKKPGLMLLSLNEKKELNEQDFYPFPELEPEKTVLE
jgi:hypothetical protein